MWGEDSGEKIAELSHKCSQIIKNGHSYWESIMDSSNRLIIGKLSMKDGASGYRDHTPYSN